MKTSFAAPTLVLCALAAVGEAQVSFSSCDVNQDGLTNVADVQTMVNEALGNAPGINDLNGDGVVDVVDVQIVTNAALGLGCSA